MSKKIEEILGKEAAETLENYIKTSVNNEFEKLENKNSKMFKLNTLHWVFIFIITLLIAVIFASLIFGR